MFGKIDVRDIIIDHFRTMVDYGTGKRAYLDLVLFLVMPSLGALWSDACRIRIAGDALDVLATVVSVLAGLLFNVLVLIHTLAARFSAPTGPKDGSRFLAQIYSNIAYAILVSLVSLLPLASLAMAVLGDAAQRVLTDVAIFLLLHLLLTLLMVLKRLHALLRLEIS